MPDQHVLPKHVNNVVPWPAIDAADGANSFISINQAVKCCEEGPHFDITPSYSAAANRAGRQIYPVMIHRTLSESFTRG